MKKTKQKLAAGIENILAIGNDFGLDSFDSGSGDLYESYQCYKEEQSGSFDDIDKLYKADRLLQNIITIPVFDSLANWRDITGNEQLASHDEAFDFVEMVKEASEKARLHDLSCIFPVLRFIDTNRIVSPRVDIERIIRPVYVSALVVHDRVLSGSDLDENINSPNYKKPLMYKCGDVEIHHSRLVLFGADECSFMDSIAGYMRDFHGTAARLYEAIRRNQSFVYKADFSEAAKYVQAQRKVGGHVQKNQLQIIAEAKASSAKANLTDNNVLVIGKNEEITDFQSQNIDDLVKAFEQQMILISGISGIPVSYLFSIIKTGLSDSGLSTILIYSQALDRFRSRSIDKPLRKLDRIFSRIYGFEYSPDSWTWSDTKAEEMIQSIRGTDNES